MSRLPERREARDVLTTAVVVASAAVSVTVFSALSPSACGPARQAHSPAPAPRASAPQPEASRPALPAADSPTQAVLADPPPAETSTIWHDPGPLGTSAEGNEIPRLPRFFSGLAQLSARQRKDHVRILWFGDSHTQADVWTDAVRAALQARFGVGGPGFVHVGWNTNGYRHAGVTLSVVGRWGIEPRTLVSGEKVDDGVFGLGGVRLVPREADPRASVQVSAAALPGPARWDLAFRFVSMGSSFQVSVSGGDSRRLEASAETLRAIQHVEIESAGPGGDLSVSRVLPGVQMLGVVIERTDAPGVVLDTLGLNGARVRSALAYDPATWQAEVARRRPDLVVIAYGTNESSDTKVNKELMVRRVKELVGRAQAAAPGSECLVFGPIDRAGPSYEDAVEALNEAEKRAAGEAGCAFWNGQAAMGGKGSMARWAMDNPPLGAGDRVHLSTRGYYKIGEMLARDLLQGFDAGTARHGGE